MYDIVYNMMSKALTRVEGLGESPDMIMAAKAMIIAEAAAAMKAASEEALGGPKEGMH